MSLLRHNAAVKRKTEVVMSLRTAFFIIVCMMPSLSLAAIQSGMADSGPSAAACEVKHSVRKQPMTEAEAKERVRQRLSREIDENTPSFRVGEIVAETDDTFIIRGYFSSQGSNAEEGCYCAVHKASGKCGIIFPPPGFRLTKELFIDCFSWETWPILF